MKNSNYKYEYKYPVLWEMYPYICLSASLLLNTTSFYVFLKVMNVTDFETSGRICYSLSYTTVYKKKGKLEGNLAASHLEP